MSVVLNEEGLNFLFRHELGPIVQHIKELGERVERRATEHASGRPGPEQRSLDLWLSIEEGLVPDPETGSFKSIIGTEQRSPRQQFNYPLQLELGSRAAFGPRPGQREYGPYPFLRPALEEVMSQV